MIQGIIFDCFGVLYHGSLGYLRTLTNPKHLQELNNLSHSYDAGYINQEDYFEQVGSLIGKSPYEVGEICQKQHYRNESMVELIRELKPHYKIGLLSNVGRGFIDQLFTKDELLEFFDAEVLSNEVGMVKPDVAIYRLTAERLNLDPSQCVMIDDIPSNIDGAKKTGMKGIICESTQQTIEDLTALLGKNYA